MVASADPRGRILPKLKVLRMRIKLVWLILSIGLMCGVAQAADKPVEIHDRIASGIGAPKLLALTLDACSGKFDDDLIEFLIRNQISIATE